MSNADFYCKELQPLMDGKVVNTAQDPEGEFFGLVIELPTGKQKILWILQDDEGNGPGSFDINDA